MNNGEDVRRLFKTMNHFRKTAGYNRGFTMIEVVAILIVIGIIAAVAVSRVISTQQDLISEADIVKTHLRFAQLKALQDDTAPWGIAFAGSSYTLYNNGTPSATVKLPGEGSNIHTFTTSPVAITVTNPSTINFDPWGSPGTVNVSLTLSDGTASKTITVTSNTGYITP